MELAEKPADNVLSSLYGQGALQELLAAPWLKDFVVCTMPVPWQAATPYFSRAERQPLSVYFVKSMRVTDVEEALKITPSSCEVVLGLGGGQALDLAKYLAWKRNARFVAVPSVTSVDAMVTPAAGLRNATGQVEYVGEVSPNPLVLDFSLIRTAPNHLNVAGIGDILSIHTASFDWELAKKHSKGKEVPVFQEEAVTQARAIMAAILDKAEAVAQCTDEGLTAIVDAYRAINTICLPLGHFRVEEGSEHYLFYKLEEQLGRGFIHGHVIGLGVYIMANLQNNKTELVGNFLEKVGLRYHPADLDISREELVIALRSLKQYVSDREDLWFTVIDCVPITEEWIDQVLAPLTFKSAS